MKRAAVTPCQRDSGREQLQEATPCQRDPGREQQRLHHAREIQEAEASSKSTRQWESPGLSVIRDKKADAYKQKDGTEPLPKTHTLATHVKPI